MTGVKFQRIDTGSTIQWVIPGQENRNSMGNPQTMVSDYIPFSVSADTACLGHIMDGNNSKYAIHHNGQYYVAHSLKAAKAKLVAMIEN